MYRIGHGYDAHRLAEGRDLWLAGVKIEHEKGLMGHSDADVAIHALCDAILGALAFGDIGYQFPDTDPRYAGIDSKILLREVCTMMREEDYELCNADITIVAQRPKLAPHIQNMRRVLADTMGVDISQISVKATTTEGLGFEGEQLGISATAVVILK